MSADGLAPPLILATVLQIARRRAGQGVGVGLRRANRATPGVKL
jgi:hypothetical protein